ncbi:MAG TPA: PEP-utilizing enzyme [Polyangiaceae bacterium]|nr:PEP-utilizing enzyme [Polyangiaceae bacterium]
MAGKTWEPPRPGAWEIELTHFPKPLTTFVSEFFGDHFVRGFAEGTRMYGILLSHLDFAIVNGFMYNAPRPVGAPLDAKGPPPKPIFKLLTWLHPEIRGRIRTSKEALQKRAWLADLAHWDESIKPQAIREHLAIQNEDPAKLDDATLAAHLGRARKNSENGTYRHGRFTMTACLPVGDYLAHAKEWTGMEIHSLLRPVKGYSAVSNGVCANETAALADAIRNDPRGESMLDGPPAEVLVRLRGEPGRIGELSRAWLDQVSYRIVTGYDLSDHYALEMPHTLVNGLRADVRVKPSREAREAIEQDVAKIRDAVPDAHRAAFDTLLADARSVYRLREERDHYNDGWATGLTRRALQEIGKRAADAGRLSSPELVIDASYAEALALLGGKNPPSSDVLRERAEWRKTDPAHVPQRLGLPPSGPPPPEWLPPHAARVARAMDLFLFGLFAPSEKESTGEIVRGIPVSAGVYEGPARVVLGPDDFSAVKQGDVLVARSTSPYFNVLLPLLGGIVTDRGGSLSHAAIVAREYGIPAVVGTKTATTSLPTGSRVRVDGGAGEVRLVA